MGLQNLASLLNSNDSLERTQIEALIYSAVWLGNVDGHFSQAEKDDLLGSLNIINADDSIATEVLQSAFRDFERLGTDEGYVDRMMDVLTALKVSSTDENPLRFSVFALLCDLVIVDGKLEVDELNHLNVIGNLLDLVPAQQMYLLYCATVRKYS